VSRSLLLFLMIALLHVLAVNAKNEPCVDETKLLMTIKSSWSDISKAATAIPEDCFDGYFGEGISDTIVRKSTKDWPGFVKELTKHKAPDDKFLLLVLRSLNATLDPDDLKAFEKLAHESCPNSLKMQCGSLVEQARKALADYDTPAKSAVPTEKH
jgi:hypothetical protein